MLIFVKLQNQLNSQHSGVSGIVCYRFVLRKICQYVIHRWPICDFQISITLPDVSSDKHVCHILADVDNIIMLSKWSRLNNMDCPFVITIWITIIYRLSDIINLMSDEFILSFVYRKGGGYHTPFRIIFRADKTLNSTIK